LEDKSPQLMGGRILGIDYGSSRVGFAVSDPMHIIATPLKTVKNSSIENLFDHINQIKIEYDIKSIVVGFPLNMKGEETKQTKSVKEFITYLKQRNWNVILEDERLTSVIAKKEIIKQNKSTGKHKSLIDKTAAALILQSYLNKNNS